MKIFANITNHPSNRWDSNQIDAVKRLFGDVEIRDYGFPNVPPNAGTYQVRDIAYKHVDNILADEDVVGALVQGEFVATIYIVDHLQAHDVDCYVATSERVVEEIVNPDGSTTKTARFKFVRLRRYPEVRIY